MLAITFRAVRRDERRFALRTLWSNRFLSRDRGCCSRYCRQYSGWRCRQFPEQSRWLSR